MAFTVRTDEELEQALDSLVETEGLSRQEIVRRAVLEKHERTSHRTRARQALTVVIERWTDEIEQLADA
ncbi:MAG: CopG-like protein DNA-binding protein [Acidimicrobiaceae bacterium]|jgi:predicted transcriptional regulator|nr:CopG-like protein DNA-binding protein [Acidimicrobiaceae bacterium]